MTYQGMDTSAVTRVRPGVCARSAEWSELFGEGRLRTRAHAVAARTERADAANSHTTAAALHGLSLFRTRTDRVHLIVPGLHTRKNSSDVVRHHLPLAERDVEVVDGLNATTLERTIYDVIRTTSLETAVACFDSALRRVAWDDHSRRYDHAAAGALREEIVSRISRGTGARGIRQARFVAGFADGRAQLPGESVSRLWMWQLQIPTPELQFRVELGHGKFALLDFAWPQLGRWAEFDGETKYHDPEMLDGRTMDEVMADQWQREQAVRRATGWRVDRWGFVQMPTLDAFAAHLRDIGLSSF